MDSKKLINIPGRGTFLAVHWLRLCASTAWVLGLIPGGGIKMPHAMKRGQNNKYTYTARQSRTPTQADPSQKSQGRANSTQYWRISALMWALGTPIQQPSPTTGAFPCSSVSSCRSTSRHLAPNCFVTRSFSPSPWRNYDLAHLKSQVRRGGVAGAAAKPAGRVYLTAEAFQL